MEKLARQEPLKTHLNLELYHNYNSFYSQKVVFTLIEKRLPYQSKILDIYKLEQYEPWYLRINPRAEVPVLKDDVKVIPDSNRIIDYLEDNFSNGNIPRLTPEKGTEQWVKIQNFRQMLDNINISFLTYGSLWHPDLSVKSNITEAQRKQRLSLFETLPAKLDELILSQPEFSQTIKEKKAKLLEVLQMKELGNFTKVLNKLENNLDKVENELASHLDDKTGWWLCSEKFSLADISLTMVLCRLKYLGLFERFVINRPCLRKYFNQAQQRDSYKKVLRQGNGTVYEKMPCKHVLSYALGSFLLLGLIVTATILYKRLK